MTMDSVERGYMHQRVVNLINSLNDLPPAEEQTALLSEIQEICELVKKQVRTIPWFEEHYPGFLFVEKPNFIEVTRPSNPLKLLAQARDIRDRLIADGMARPRVYYGEGWWIDIPIDDPSTGIADKLKRDYGRVFKIFPTPGTDWWNFVYREATTQTDAEAFGNMLKQRYPWMFVIVRYITVDDPDTEIRFVPK